MKCEKKWKRKPWVAVCIFFLVMTAGCQGIWQQEQSPQPDKAVETAAVPEETTGSGEIYVHVCGHVKKPGLYILGRGARAGEAVEAAGGLKPGADEASVNLAAPLEDGMQLYIASRRKEGDASGKGDGDGEGKININRADVGELTTLSGIGESRARAIIAWREENGAYSSIEDVKNVSGIGDGIFERIKNMITV